MEMRKLMLFALGVIFAGSAAMLQASAPLRGDEESEAEGGTMPGGAGCTWCRNSCPSNVSNYCNNKCGGGPGSSCTYGACLGVNQKIYTHTISCPGT